MRPPLIGVRTVGHMRVHQRRRVRLFRQTIARTKVGGIRSRQPQIAAVTIACEQTTGASRLDGSRRAYAYVPAPSAIVAQPRAPPLRRTLTAA